MSKPESHLTFGKPETVEQALLRLPDRTHPLYEKDQVIEHLAHFKEWFIETYLQIMGGRLARLDNRFAPLTVEEIIIMKNLSFARDKVLFTANWNFVPKTLYPWYKLYPTEDNEYRWWQVSEMLPQPKLPHGIKLVAIETNKEFNLNQTGWRLNDQSDFEVGFTESAELKLLRTNLI